MHILPLYVTSSRFLIRHVKTNSTLTGTAVKIEPVCSGNSGARIILCLENGAVFDEGALAGLIQKIVAEEGLL